MVKEVPVCMDCMTRTPEDHPSLPESPGPPLGPVPQHQILIPAYFLPGGADRACLSTEL